MNGFTQLSIYQQTDSVAITVSINRNNAPRGLIADTLLRLISQSLLTSIEEDNFDKIDFSVYPNPANDKIHFRTNSASNERITVSLVNQIGKVILENASIDVDGIEDYVIDVSNLAAGLYFVKVKTDKHILTRRIVVLNRTN